MFILRKILLFLAPRDNPQLKTEQSQFPAIRECVFRPYVNRHWTTRSKLDAIENHYLLVHQHVPFLNIANGQTVEIARYEFAEDQLRIVMDRPSWMRLEGELGISIFYGIDRIYTAMLVLGGTPSNLNLIVGNLQGDGRDRQALYKAFTKAMHGIRPRDFLVHTVKILAGELGCKEVLGISDDAHRSAHWLTRAKKVSTYDEIWLEHDGIKDDSSGFFRILPGIAKRTAEDVPSNKRALYRRRYQMLDELQLKIRAHVNAPAGG
jgi:uncharacterized protein VirK/YbjX